MSIPFIDLKTQYKKLKTEIDQSIHAVLDHGQYIMGPEVKKCEELLVEYTGAKHALTCGNGTDALILALMALHIGPGDEVIVPGFSFIASAEVILLVGAKPVFADIEKDTYNISVTEIEKVITKNTKAIIPVSLFGQPADMNEINSLAKKHNLTVIEDAAQSFGGSYNGKKSCNLSTLATTSFFPAKPLGCYGDGGAVFTDNEELHEKMESLRIHGQSKEERYKHINIGINGRMDSIQCAVINTKLPSFQWEVEQRQQVADRYNEAFNGLDSKGLLIPTVRDDRASVHAQYTIRVNQRDDFRARLSDKQIPTAVHYPIPMYRQPAYKDLEVNPTAAAGNTLPNCEWASQGVVSLPMHPFMDKATQEQIIAGVIEAV